MKSSNQPTLIEQGTLMKHKQRTTALVLLTAMLLTGCAATTTAISHKDLKVQTQMSDSIFLNPVPKSQRTVYVEIKNTSDQASFSISKDVKQAIEGKGYRVINNPDKAHYRLQANILKVETMTPKQASTFLSAGYGALIGAGATSAITHNASESIAGGLIGGLVGTVADAMVKDVTVAVITDIQLSEHTQNNIAQHSQANLKQGTSTFVQQNSHTTTHWQHYRARIVSTADKVNLTITSALPPLEHGITTALAGLF
jgi:predicted component of type VI protein secretion system